MAFRIPTESELLRHKRELERVIAEDAFSCTTTLARKYLRLVEDALTRPADFEGWFGTYARTIESIVKDADIQARLNRMARLTDEERDELERGRMGVAA
jgi:hypothetical protein